MPPGATDNSQSIIKMSLVQHDLDREIDQHEQDDNQRSYLGRLVDLVWNPGSSTLEDLQNLKREVEQKAQTGNDADRLVSQSALTIQRDRRAEAIGDEVKHYATTALKVAPLFMTGNDAWITTGVAWGADQARPADSAGAQMLDATLGATKGLAVKGLVSAVSGQDWNLGLKGAVMGAGNRALDGILTRQTWENAEGKVDFGAGLGKVVSSTTDTRALAADVLVFGVVGGLGAAAGKFAPAIGASPLLATTSTAGIFGITSGALGEVQRERAAGQKIDWSQVAMRGGLEGTVYALAAVPGGMQNEIALRNMQAAMQQQSVDQNAAPADEAASKTDAQADPAKPVALNLKPEDIPVAEKMTAEQTNQLYSDLTQSGEYNFVKQTYTADVRPAVEGEQITTIKGDVEVAKPNSLVITRSMSDGSADQYFISPEKLAQRWQPASGQQTGEAGTYQTVAGNPTKMVELNRPVRIGVSWAPDGVTGAAGDFLAQYGPGDYNIVHAPALLETYAGNDAPSSAKISQITGKK